MCTYNGGEFLALQLESIAAQTVAPDELVVCDDRSTDATLEVLERFRERAPFPVRLFVNPATLRPAQNFAKCISLCEGDVIVLTDQDDLWFPDRVERTREAFRSNPAATVVYSDAPLIGQQGETLNRSIYSSLPVRAEDAERLQRGGDLLGVLTRYSVLCGATMAFRASLRDVALPVPQLWMHDEWIALIGNALGPAVRLPSPVMEYRQHANQELGTGEWTVGTHLRVARARQAEFYRAEMQRLQNGIEAVERHPELAAVLLPLLEGKRAFCRDRLRIYTRGVRALPVLTQLLFSGSYRRYGSGLRSSIKDFVVMIGRTLRPGAEA